MIIRILNDYNNLNSTIFQFTSPVFTAPYNESEPRDRLLANYELVHGKVHDENCPLKLLYKVDGKETMLAWVGWICYIYKIF